MIAYEDNNFSIIVLLIMSWMMMFSLVGVTLIVCGCCDKKKKKHRNQDGQDQKANGDEKLQNGEKKDENAEKKSASKEKVKKANKPVVFAETNEYETLQNMDKINPTVMPGMKKTGTTIGQAAPPPETMAYNIIPSTLMKQAANLVVKKPKSEPKQEKYDVQVDDDVVEKPPKFLSGISPAPAGGTIMAVPYRKKPLPKHAPPVETIGYKIVQPEVAENANKLVKKAHSPVKTTRPGSPAMKDFVDRREYGTLAAVQGDALHASDRRNEIRDQTTTSTLKKRIENDLRRLKEKEKEKKGGQRKDTEKNQLCSHEEKNKEEKKHHPKSKEDKHKLKHR